MSAAGEIPSLTRGASVKPENSFPSVLLNGYLFLYNGTSFGLWSYILVSTVRHLAVKYLVGHSGVDLLFIYEAIFPTLLWTQTLAVLEVNHSLLRIVRASLMTTLMQVASRLFVVWPVLFCFGRGGYFVNGVADQVEDIIRPNGIGSYAFVGCIIAWSITECVRYSFFCMQVAGMKTPAVIQWLRYNMFFVLYPIGIASECTLTYLSLTPARRVHDLFAGLFLAVLVIYVPAPSLQDVFLQRLTVLGRILYPLHAHDVSTTKGHEKTSEDSMSSYGKCCGSLVATEVLHFPMTEAQKYLETSGG
ncbi:hypothetical protein KEM54_005333 [Ascosphaera aggregata]|nr:hypothetical protein KEM54_005333 [Ascosphaera aggregata]